MMPPFPPGGVRFRFVNEAGEEVQPNHCRPIAPTPPLLDAKSLSPADYAAAKRRLVAESANAAPAPAAVDAPDARQLSDADYRNARAKLLGR